MMPTIFRLNNFSPDYTDFQRQFSVRERQTNLKQVAGRKMMTKKRRMEIANKAGGVGQSKRYSAYGGTAPLPPGKARLVRRAAEKLGYTNVDLKKKPLVKRLQQKLNIVDDGKVGRQTYRALVHEASKR
jgi:murein L,D-transpeptidase YcbB/YkuD